MKVSNLSDVGQMRRSSGTSIKRIMKAVALHAKCQHVG